MRSSFLRHVAPMAVAAVSMCGLMIPSASFAQMANAVGVTGGVTKIAKETSSPGRINPCDVQPARSGNSGTGQHECGSLTVKATHPDGNGSNSATRVAQVSPR